jgi:long-chain acyl-CoA synthetase
VLSVLPLHHTFEFTCGLLLPLMLGARILYIRELNASALKEGLEMGRITAMAGVPALWQLLERRILTEVKERGPVAARAFDMALELNRLIGKQTGLNAGRLFFGQVHAELGGNMRHLISGGAALPKETAKLFAGIGLPLSEGYGLTEAAPVLTVAKASAKGSFGHVGKPVPGVEVKIDSPDGSGVGEIIARGPNIMRGYEGNEAATKQAIDESGWLHTGDLGKFDKRGQLVIVGRHKEVIVGPSGENVYPDDVEALLGNVSGVKELSIVGLSGSSSGERVACLAVPKPPPNSDDETAEPETAVARTERHKRVMSSLREAFEKLPKVARPSVVHLYEADLPRTATRKVKRSEVQLILERLATASVPPREGGRSAVRHVIASISNRAEGDIHGSTSLRGDLGIDSLLGVELMTALESQLGFSLDARDLGRAETVADLEEVVSKAARGRALLKPEATEIEDVSREDITLPEPVADAAKKIMTRFQMGFYERGMRPTVTGRAHIPYNRNTIVISNHASHLDMGFVKYALGTYGEKMVTLAAQDYFFDGQGGVLGGSKWRRFYIENLTNLAPFDRKGGLRKALELAGELLDKGETILIFPEGTRSTDGAIQEFKPVIGHLALTKGVDILPVYLGGTYEAMRKGTRFPTKRDITAKIGLPLEVVDLERLTAGMKPSAAYRKIASLAEQAVRALKDGRLFDLSEVERAEHANGVANGAHANGAKPVIEHPLVVLFRELEGRFVVGRVEKPITYFFTLGAEQNEKWTLRVDKETCKANIGKPEGAQADCVLKTSAEIFTRIVREAYTPSPMEFLSGAIKSNDVSLLQTFQKVFDLN